MSEPLCCLGQQTLSNKLSGASFGTEGFLKNSEKCVSVETSLEMSGKFSGRYQILQIILTSKVYLGSQIVQCNSSKKSVNFWQERLVKMHASYHHSKQIEICRSIAYTGSVTKIIESTYDSMYNMQSDLKFVPSPGGFPW